MIKCCDNQSCRQLEEILECTYVSVQVRVREQTCTNMYKHNYRVPADTYNISKAQH